MNGGQLEWEVSDSAKVGSVLCRMSACKLE